MLGLLTELAGSSLCLFIPPQPQAAIINKVSAPDEVASPRPESTGHQPGNSHKAHPDRVLKHLLDDSVVLTSLFFSGMAIMSSDFVFC